MFRPRLWVAPLRFWVSPFRFGVSPSRLGQSKVSRPGAQKRPYPNPLWLELLIDRPTEVFIQNPECFSLGGAGVITVRVRTEQYTIWRQVHLGPGGGVGYASWAQEP